MQKFPGSIIKGKNNKSYLAVYCFQHDVFIKPSWDMKGLERIAHVSYSKGGKQGGVDYFLITNNRNLENDVRIKKTFQYSPNGIKVSSKEDGDWTIPKETFKDAERKYDIHTVRIALDDSIRKEITDFSRADIADFCGDNIAKKTREGRKNKIVDEIKPTTRIKRINPERVLTGGKQEFIPQCILTANIDFMRGCITGFVPGEKGGFFDGEFFHNFFSMPTGECQYCYAERQHKSFPKNFYVFDIERLEKELRGECTLIYDSPVLHGKPIDILRFGKRTESWTPFTHEEFMQTLETMAKVGTKGIIPTKFIPFRKDIAKMLKKTNSTLLYSVGFNEVEKGAVAYGSTNEWRLQQARQFKDAGVNSNIYLMINAHAPPQEREKRILEFAEYGEKIPIQLLPMRFKGKKIVEKITGDKWDTLCECPELGVFDFANDVGRGSYKREQQQLLCIDIDNSWINMIRNNNQNIRMCHHTDDTVYCGGCFQTPGGIYKK